LKKNPLNKQNILKNFPKKCRPKRTAFFNKKTSKSPAGTKWPKVPQDPVKLIPRRPGPAGLVSDLELYHAPADCPKMVTLPF